MSHIEQLRERIGQVLHTGGFSFVHVAQLKQAIVDIENGRVFSQDQINQIKGVS
jgi:hypothetical protein